VLIVFYLQRGGRPFVRLLACIILSLVIHGSWLFCFLSVCRSGGGHLEVGGQKKTISAVIKGRIDGSGEQRLLAINSSRDDVFSKQETVKGNGRLDGSLDEESSSPRMVGEGGPYFPGELDEQPQIIEDPNIERYFYNSIVSGKIRLTLMISGAGVVIWYYVDYSDFPDSVAQGVVDEFARSLFYPGKKGGDSVVSIIHVEVDHSYSEK